MPLSPPRHSILRDTGRVKEICRRAGFPLVRFAAAAQLTPERERYLRWLEEGRQAGMGWMTPERAVRSTSPEAVLPGCRSIVSVALPYWSGHRPAPGRNEGAVARYAWGRDYHTEMGNRLRTAVEALEAAFGGEHRWYVDTGPMLDKALAARSGLGWYGKNSNVLTEELGSWVLLGEILTSLDLTPDQPLDRTCGSCRLCTVACPTGALDTEYSVDSAKCISYLTIEHRGPIPRELRGLMGAWVFGCDICQDVCPPTMQPLLATEQQRTQWVSQTRLHARTRAAGPHRGVSGQFEPTDLVPERPRPTVDLVWLLGLQHQEYLEAFRGTSIRRAKVWMLRRNAAVALGNVGDARVTGALEESLQRDEEPIVRSHAAWALGQLGRRLALDTRTALERAKATERDPNVLEEIEWALVD